MQAADNGMNEVMIMSPILEEYLREKYPSYKFNSSTCKEIKDIDGILSELEKDYYMVVLDYNMNDRFDLLEQIPMEHRHRVELLVNTLCIPRFLLPIITILKDIERFGWEIFIQEKIFF
mgnify:CR=1 FL=1